MFRRVRLWNSLANGFILDAFCRSAGVEYRGTAALRELLPAASGLPVVL
jgi:hypothetical protein